MQKYKDRRLPALNALFYNYKRIAKLRNLVFDIPKEVFMRITSSNCFYCGMAPQSIISDNIHWDKSSYTYNGVDRIDNTRGYTLDNIVPCCITCNFTKGNLEYNDFMHWIKKITDNIENISSYALHST